MNLEEAIAQRGLEEKPMGSLELDRRGGYGNWTMLSFDLQLRRNVGRSPVRLNARSIAHLVTTVGARVPECWAEGGPGTQVAKDTGYAVERIEYTEDGLVEAVTFTRVGDDKLWGSNIPTLARLLEDPVYAVRVDTKSNTKTIHLTRCTCVLRKKNSKVSIWKTGLTYHDVRSMLQGTDHWCNNCRANSTYRVGTYQNTCVQEFREHGQVSQFDRDPMY